MAEDELKLQEEADDKLINEAFDRLLNDYISSRHRKKVDLITKAFLQLDILIELFVK